MNSDYVNSIDETTESQMVTEIVRETYEEIAAQRDWPWLRKLIQLEGMSDTSFPTRMVIPEGVDYIQWIKYDARRALSEPKTMQEVCYMSPDEFLDFINARRSDAPNVEEYIDPDSGVSFNIVNDNGPQYWTSLDNVHVIMDGYRADIENTLQGSKTSAYAVGVPQWETDDEFVLPMPAKMFPLLMADAKHTANVNLRQIDNSKEAAKARRQNNTMQHRSYRQDNKPKWRAYGRRQSR